MDATDTSSGLGPQSPDQDNDVQGGISETEADESDHGEQLVEDRTEGPPPLPLDGIFEILKNERRRMTLEYLDTHENPVSLSDLAEHVAARENDIEERELNSTERKRAYVGLYQCHLPKMDEMGAIEFNRPRGLIEKGPHTDQLEPYLEENEVEADWSRYYLGLAGGSAALLAVSLLGAAQFGLTAPLVAAATIVGFSALALYHHFAAGEESNEFDDAVADAIDRLGVSDTGSD